VCDKEPLSPFALKGAGDNDLSRAELVPCLLDRLFKSREGDGLIRLRGKVAEPVRSVGDFYVVNSGRKFETAHGLPDVLHSVAAEIPLDFQLDPLCLRLD